MKYNRISLFGIFIVALLSCGKQKDETTAIRKDIVQAVYASGKLFPKQHYTVVSKFPGYIQQIHVKAGDAVRSGQILLTVRNEIGKLNTMSARNQLLLAEENADVDGTLLTSLKQEVASAESKYKLDSATFARFAVLQKENATSTQAYDQAKTQFDISASNYKKALESFENTRSRLNIELKNARNLLSAQESTENEYTILSVLNGKVYDVVPQVGDLVGPQSPLMEIGDSTEFEVELAVDETDISFLSTGQEIAYSIDAFPGKIFKGRITGLYPKVNATSKTAKVIGSFNYEKGMELYSGMSVEANIVFREKKNALVVPKDFIIKGNKVSVKGKDEQVTLKIGVEDLEYVEVLSGINENDVLIKK